MHRVTQKRSVKSGLAPGTLVHIGERKVDKTKIVVIAYAAAHVDELTPQTVEECLPQKSQAGVTWINVDGLHETEALGKFGEQFGLHPLVIEDILNTEQRPKVEDYGEYIFCVLKSLYHLDKESGEPETEQISLRRH